ncbi:MAG: hypothetical protein NZM12_06565 [Steroidobacteraceae bacterium]|nr:hypothetical protein [Steroidobacteraceae bacterium]MDW8258949.1 hypothetical protein [Gammaproteobacteria bacterium]
MNETEFLRRQIETERAHMAAVCRALDAALEQPAADPIVERFVRAAARYLVFVSERFNRQEQAHCEILSARLAAEAQTERRLLADWSDTLRRNAAAVAAVASSLDAAADNLADACRRYLRFYRDSLAQRLHLTRHLPEQLYGLREWRRAAGLDADSIWRERELYSAVCAQLPPGIALQETPG